MADTVLNSPRVLGLRTTPINQRRWANFRRNRRGYWSLWVFLLLFILSLFAEVLSNDKPILVLYDGGLYVPFAKAYPEMSEAPSEDT